MKSLDFMRGNLWKFNLYFSRWVILYMCVCVCVNHVCMHVWWLHSGSVSYLCRVMGGGRKRRARVSPWQTHLLVALYKARRGERERRSNRYWQGTLWNKGRPTCCLLTETAPHAQLQNGASMQTASPATQQIDLSRIPFTSCAFHTGPTGC